MSGLSSGAERRVPPSSLQPLFILPPPRSKRKGQHKITLTQGCKDLQKVTSGYSYIAIYYLVSYIIALLPSSRGIFRPVSKCCSDLGQMKLSVCSLKHNEV